MTLARRATTTGRPVNAPGSLEPDPERKDLMSDVQFNSSPPSTDDGGGSAAGVIVGGILGILLIAGLVWYLGTPRAVTPTTTTPANPGQTINVNNPPSQPAATAAGSSAQPTAPSQQPSAAGSSSNSTSSSNSGTTQPAGSNSTGTPTQ